MINFENLVEVFPPASTLVTILLTTEPLKAAATRKLSGSVPLFAFRRVFQRDVHINADSNVTPINVGISGNYSATITCGCNSFIISLRLVDSRQFHHTLCPMRNLSDFRRIWTVPEGRMHHLRKIDGNDDLRRSFRPANFALMNDIFPILLLLS